MSPWVGGIRNFVPYPPSSLSPGSDVLELAIGWLLGGSTCFSSYGLGGISAALLMLMPAVGT